MLGLGRGELILTGIIVVLIFAWSWLPRLGQIVGGMFDKR